MALEARSQPKIDLLQCQESIGQFSSVDVSVRGFVGLSIKARVWPGGQDPICGEANFCWGYECARPTPTLTCMALHMMVQQEPQVGAPTIKGYPPVKVN